MSSLSPIDRAVRIAGSQTLLAEKIGRSQNWVSRVSAGKIASISIDDAVAIEAATGGAVKAIEFARRGAPETGAELASPAAASQQSGSQANRVPAERRSPAEALPEEAPGPPRFAGKAPGAGDVSERGAA